MSYGGSWVHDKVHDWKMLHNVGDDAFPKDSPEDIEGTWQYNITMGLAIRMKSIGISRIKDDNIELVYMRCLQVDKVLGPVLNKYHDEADKNGRRMRPYTISLDDIQRRVGLWASTDNDRPLSDAGFTKRLGDELAQQAKRESATARGDWRARNLIRGLKAGDDWTDQHDQAARRLGLEPDNYRANPEAVDNWPEDMLGKVMFDTGQAILDHYDHYKKKRDEKKEKA